MMDKDTVKEIWLMEARAELEDYNPLDGFCERIYFVRPRRKNAEVELIKFLPSGRCVQFKDMDTKQIDSLAEEVFSRHLPGTDRVNLFIEYFKKLKPSNL